MHEAQRVVVACLNLCQPDAWEARLLTVSQRLAISIPSDCRDLRRVSWSLSAAGTTSTGGPSDACSIDITTFDTIGDCERPRGSPSAAAALERFQSFRAQPYNLALFGANLAKLLVSLSSAWPCASRENAGPVAAVTPLFQPVGRGIRKGPH